MSIIFPINAYTRSEKSRQLASPSGSRRLNPETFSFTSSLCLIFSLVEKQHGLASLVSPEIDSPDQIKRDPTVEDDGEFGGTIAVSEPAILTESHQMGSETGVEVGKQNPLQDELNTPVKGNSFASSPNSTPVGKLFLPSPDDNTATTPEDVEDDRSTSPRTPRQDEQKFNMVDECLQFWLVLKILEDEVTIFFHRR